MHGVSIAVSGLGEAGQQIKSFGAVSHVHQSTHKEPRSASQTASSIMHLTLLATRRTPHCAPRLVQAMPAWSVRTRRPPSRHRSDLRVYGHVTTAVHGTPPPTHTGTHTGTHTATHMLIVGMGIPWRFIVLVRALPVRTCYGYDWRSVAVLYKYFFSPSTPYS